jgi:hypothetical protein
VPICTAFGEDPPACSLVGIIPAPPVRLETGGWFEHPWSAWLVAGTTIPAECAAPEVGAQGCVVPVLAGAGNYEIQGEAVTAELCEDGCECVPDQNGACEVTGSAPSSNISATTVWDGICDVIEIRFGR